MSHLTDGWDGLGAPAPKPNIIEKFRRWAHFLEAIGVQCPTRVLAGLSGNVLLEWQTSGAYFEIEIDAEGAVSAVRELSDETYWYSGDL
jgi:hypothetical protein